MTFFHTDFFLIFGSFTNFNYSTELWQEKGIQKQVTNKNLHYF